MAGLTGPGVEEKWPQSGQGRTKRGRIEGLNWWCCGVLPEYWGVAMEKVEMGVRVFPVPCARNVDDPHSNSPQQIRLNFIL